jgi:hypothetical protein
MKVAVTIKDGRIGRRRSTDLSLSCGVRVGIADCRFFGIKACAPIENTSWEEHGWL